LLAAFAGAPLPVEPTVLETALVVREVRRSVRNGPLRQPWC